MVDIMTTTSEDYSKKDDFEDGELPEDGEIQDDEDNVAPGVSSPPTTSTALPPATTTSPPQRKFAPKGYGDDTEVPNRNIWGPSEGNNEYNYGGEDRDYRFAEQEDFGDSDYRQGPPNRRGKRSPPIDDYDGPRGPRGRPWRGGFKKPKWATEHQICKFFREGYCRDGDQCTYSHQAEDSLRKPELCRFYANGYCKKGLTCLALHGEFPCIQFHKGECTAEHCRYSHLPLTEYTQPLYDQKVKEEEMGISHRGPPFPSSSHPGARRRVLLPNGPDGSNPASGQQLNSQPPAIHTPLPQPSNGQLPPPTVVVPTIAPSTQHHPSYSHMPPRGSFFPVPSASHQQSPQRMEETSQSASLSAPAPAFDISSMLARIAGESTVDDSPASPPMFGETSTEPIRAIPEVQEVTWRLVPVEIPRPYTGVDTNLAPNDPRMSRIIASQFDAVSSLFATEDPRMRDPRRRPEDKRPSEDRPRISSWMPQIA